MLGGNVLLHSRVAEPVVVVVTVVDGGGAGGGPGVVVTVVVVVLYPSIIGSWISFTVTE